MLAFRHGKSAPTVTPFRSRGRTVYPPDPADAAGAGDARRWFAARQFENPDNAEAHRMFTGPESLAQMECGCVDAVASGVGTGGTLLGLWQAFDDAGCGARAYAAIPCEGGAFRDNAECSSLAFSKEVPGVVDCLFSHRVFAGLRAED